jgi:hypothetical protein
MGESLQHDHKGVALPRVCDGTPGKTQCRSASRRCPLGPRRTRTGTEPRLSRPLVSRIRQNRLTGLKGAPGILEPTPIGLARARA